MVIDSSQPEREEFEFLNTNNAHHASPSAAGQCAADELFLEGQLLPLDRDSRLRVLHILQHQSSSRFASLTLNQGATAVSMSTLSSPGRELGNRLRDPCDCLDVLEWESGSSLFSSWSRPGFQDSSRYAHTEMDLRNMASVSRLSPRISKGILHQDKQEHGACSKNGKKWSWKSIIAGLFKTVSRLSIPHGRYERHSKREFDLGAHSLYVNKMLPAQSQNGRQSTTRSCSRNPYRKMSRNKGTTSLSFEHAHVQPAKADVASQYSSLKPKCGIIPWNPIAGSHHKFLNTEATQARIKRLHERDYCLNLWRNRSNICERGCPAAMASCMGPGDLSKRKTCSWSATCTPPLNDGPNKGVIGNYENNHQISRNHWAGFAASCPASIGSSPNHSGSLSSTPRCNSQYHLHAAIQGAIAHCKQSHK